MKKYIVIRKWTTDYNDPITILSGQEVLIDTSRKDDTPDWQGWVWCISADNAGWVPKQILRITKQTDSLMSKATVLEDYSAKEHNVVAGEMVSGDKILNGWLHCKKVDEEILGWLPLSNLNEM